MAISIEEATLVSIFCECILYGLFLSLFTLSITIILGRHRKNPSTRAINLKLLGVSVLMFIAATIHVGTSLDRVLDAFINKRSDLSNPNATSLELSAINTTAYTVKICAYTFQTLLGDAFMIYRMYMVWHGNRLVCGPAAVTFLGGFACAIGAVQASVRAPTFLEAPIFRAGQNDWIVSWLSLTLFTNAYATGGITIFNTAEFPLTTVALTSVIACIAGRIWWVPHKISDMSNVGNFRIGQPAVIIIESGAIYSISLILLIILYELRTYAQTIVLECMVQIVGIVFTLVIVRVALGVAGGMPSSRGSHTQEIRMKNMLNSVTSTSFGPGLRGKGDHAFSRGGGPFLAVEVVKEEDTHYDESVPDMELKERNSA